MSKLLIVTTIPSTLNAFLLPFAHYFRAQGWRVDAMACGITANTECLQAFDRLWDIQWSRNPLNPINLAVAPGIIQEIVQQEKYDIVHVHTPVAAFVTRYALKNLRKQLNTQVIYTAHGFHFYSGGKALKNTLFLALEKLARYWTDYLVVINREDQEAAKQQKLISPERLHYMPGIGVDLQYYHPDSTSDTNIERLRQELGLATNTPLFLSVAEFIPRKRLQDILKAYARLARPEICLAFAGNGVLMEQMQQLALQLNLQNQVRFLGVRRDIPTLMRAAVATLLVSEQEGLPRCVMESMSLETPVIGTNIRGTRDLLTEDCGLLVEIGDVEAITKAMAWILDHPEEARIIGKRGRERMADYDMKEIIRLHASLYAEATNFSQT
jgi:glycosyltransferase involved in cell wall biosynthesis